MLTTLMRSLGPSTMTKRTVRQNAPTVPDQEDPQGLDLSLFNLSKLGRALALLGARQNPYQENT